VTGLHQSSSTSASVFDRQFDLLKVEIELVNNAIRQHDEITKSIKNWAIVTWTASMGAVLSDTKFHSFLWLVGAVPLLFWMVDGLFRRIQMTFIYREGEIADYLNSDAFQREAEKGLPMSLQLMQMRVRPSTRRDWFAMYFHILRYYSVSSLYIGLAGLSVLVWLCVGVFRGAP
jgi:hypothetical protein